MMRDPSVLIPSYNEAKTIGSIVSRLKGRDLAVYVVDDGSSDKTGEIAASAGAIVIKNDRNLGKGASLRRGFERVLEDGCDAVIVMDGDDQHDAADIGHLVEKARECPAAGIVIGNRMLDTASMPRIRVIVNKLMSLVMSRFAGQYVPDSQCGFRLIRREVLEKIELESSNFEIESEMIVKAAKANFRIESAPVKTVYQDEKSKINPLIDTLRFIVLMIKLNRGK